MLVSEGDPSTKCCAFCPLGTAQDDSERIGFTNSVSCGLYLTQISGGRENFSRVYEQPFSDALAYYESLTGDNATAVQLFIAEFDENCEMSGAPFLYKK